MTSPLCTVNATATTNGVDVAGSSTVTIALADVSGVKQWAISCIGTDETNAPTTITAALSVNLTTKTATFTAPAGASALIFQSKVNNGLTNGVVDPTLTTTFGVYVLTGLGYRVGAFGETTEGNAAVGWSKKFNDVVRNATNTPASAGNGILYTAGVYSVKPDAEGSIVVAAGGVKVGVLASDAEHGNRGNGALHTVADATHDGFLPQGFWSLLNGASTGATFNTLAKRDGLGQCTFAGLTVTVSGISVTGGVSADTATFVAGTNSSITQTQEPGTGSATGRTLTIKAQQGQAQTGSNNNTQGGTLILSGGDAGTGGSGSAGTQGNIILPGQNVTVAAAGSVSISGSSVTLKNTGNVTMLTASGSALGLYAATPVAQASRVGQLTDSTGGSVSSTLAAGITDTVAKNAIASLAAKVNAIELALHNLGVTA